MKMADVAQKIHESPTLSKLFDEAATGYLQHCETLARERTDGMKSPFSPPLLQARDAYGNHAEYMLNMVLDIEAGKRPEFTQDRADGERDSLFQNARFTVLSQAFRELKISKAPFEEAATKILTRQPFIQHIKHD